MKISYKKSTCLREEENNVDTEELLQPAKVIMMYQSGIRQSLLF